EEDVSQFVSKMAYLDPMWVAEHSSELPSLHDADVQVVISALLDLDSNQALEWAFKIDDTDKQTTALQRIFGTLAAANLEEAVRAFNDLPADYQSTPVLTTIAAALGKDNWEHAKEFARINASSEDELESLLTTALRAGVRSGSSVAVEEMKEFLTAHPNGPSAEGAVPTIVNYGFWDDRHTLAETIRSLPTGSVQDQAIEQLTSMWSGFDPIAT